MACKGATHAEKPQVNYPAEGHVSGEGRIPRLESERPLAGFFSSFRLIQESGFIMHGG